jgi:Tat protein translocase TatC
MKRVFLYINVLNNFNFIIDMGQNKKLLIPYSLNIKQNDAEMSLSDHLEELRQRAFWSVAVLLSSILICVFSVKNIVKILQEPALGIKFLQFAPGEYFFASIKVAAYTGLLISSPFLIYQIMLFVLPGMTKDERKTILPIIMKKQLKILLYTDTCNLLSLLKYMKTNHFLTLTIISASISKN